MEHLLPHKHPLPKPALLKTPAFNELLARVKATIIGHLKKSDPVMATEVEKTLENPAEVMTKWTEAITVILQNQTREFNDLALQMFGMYARDDKLIDVIVSSLGLKRQVITPAQPEANPPVEAVMEKNDDLLTRFFLAVHSLASTGTKLGYRYHALTLGGRPEMTVTSPEPGKVIVEYVYKKHPFAGQTKDAVAKQVSPGVVDVFVLAHGGDGTPSDELVEATQSHLTRKDIGQETDKLTVKKATIRPLSLNLTLYFDSSADQSIKVEAARAAALRYASENHRLGGRIEPTKITNVLMQSSGAARLEGALPTIRCAENEAPHLNEITITAKVDRL